MVRLKSYYFNLCNFIFAQNDQRNSFVHIKLEAPFVTIIG